MPVPGLASVVGLAASADHTCALLSDGTARCWGDNSYGQLGDGTTTARMAPVAVAGLTGATALTAGLWHTCARLMDGTARCWGYNARGEVGDGHWAYQPTPVAVRF